MTGDRPLVLIAHHSPGWCQGMVAESVAHYYNGPANVEAIDVSNMKRKRVIDKFGKAALCVPLYWFLADRIVRFTAMPKRKMLIAIRGYSGLPEKGVPGGRSQSVQLFCESAVGLLCANKRLAELWTGKHPHVYVGYSSVDRRLWFPPKTPRKRGDKVVVGWTGNANRGDKRVHTFLRPAISKSGHKVRLLIQDGGSNPVPYRDMKEAFYYNIDILAVTSIAEGTPNPALEAMACGAPVISVPVGHIPEIITPGMDGWIVKNDVAAFALRLRQLSDEPQKIKHAAKLAQHTALAWSWENTIYYWEHAINSSLLKLGALNKQNVGKSVLEPRQSAPHIVMLEDRGTPDTKVGHMQLNVARILSRRFHQFGVYGSGWEAMGVRWRDTSCELIPDNTVAAIITQVNVATIQRCVDRGMHLLVAEPLMDHISRLPVKKVISWKTALQCRVKLEELVDV